MLILSDPMIATGSSLGEIDRVFERKAISSELHIVCAIACTVGLEYVLGRNPRQPSGAAISTMR